MMLFSRKMLLGLEAPSRRSMHVSGSLDHRILPCVPSSLDSSESTHTMSRLTCVLSDIVIELECAASRIDPGRACQDVNQALIKSGVQAFLFQKSFSFLFRPPSHGVDDVRVDWPCQFFAQTNELRAASSAGRIVDSAEFVGVSRLSHSDLSAKGPQSLHDSSPSCGDQRSRVAFIKPNWKPLGGPWVPKHTLGHCRIRPYVANTLFYEAWVPLRTVQARGQDKYNTPYLICISFA